METCEPLDSFQREKLVDSVINKLYWGNYTREALRDEVEKLMIQTTLSPYEQVFIDIGNFILSLPDSEHYSAFTLEGLYKRNPNLIKKFLMQQLFYSEEIKNSVLKKYKK